MIVLERVEKVVLPTDAFLLFSPVLAIHCTRFRPCWSQSTLENISAQCKFFEISTDRFKQSYLFHCALQNSCVFAVLVYSLGQNEMMPTPPHSSCKINHTKVKMGHFTIFDFLSYWIFFWGGGSKLSIKFVQDCNLGNSKPFLHPLKNGWSFLKLKRVIWGRGWRDNQKFLCILSKNSSSQVWNGKGTFYVWSLF